MCHQNDSIKRGIGEFPVNRKGFRNGDSAGIGRVDLRRTQTVAVRFIGNAVGVIDVTSDATKGVVAQIPLRGEIQTLELIPFFAHGAAEELTFTFYGEGEGDFLSVILS